MWLWWRGSTCNQARIFQKVSVSLMKTLLVPRHSVTMKDFSAFLDRRRDKNWAHKINSWEHLTIWRPVLPVPHWTQSASFLLSSLNSFRGCWRSAAAAAHDLILVEVDGKHSWQVPVCRWCYHNWWNRGCGLLLAPSGYSQGMLKILNQCYQI